MKSKQVRDMSCIEALDALMEDLQSLNENGNYRLPEIRFFEILINRAKEMHVKEVNESKMFEAKNGCIYFGEEPYMP